MWLTHPSRTLPRLRPRWSSRLTIPRTCPSNPGGKSTGEKILGNFSGKKNELARPWKSEEATVDTLECETKCFPFENVFSLLFSFEAKLISDRTTSRHADVIKRKRESTRWGAKYNSLPFKTFFVLFFFFSRLCFIPDTTHRLRVLPPRRGPLRLRGTAVFCFLCFSDNIICACFVW